MVRTCLGLGAVFPALLFCQAEKSFEVASIKPSAPGSVSESRHIRTGKIFYENVSLMTLLTEAFNVREYQIIGSNWLGAARFDIIASMPPDTTREQGMRMLQALLAERFKLVEHRETRELPIYELVAAKGGVKMKEASGQGGSDMNSARGRIEGENVRMAAIAARLANLLRRPVTDRTGLAGAYDFKLEFTPLAAGEDPDAITGPSIFTALQEQLGLKLESRKGPVDVIVIDRIERTPTEN